MTLRPAPRPSAAQVVVASFLAFVALGTAALSLPACRLGEPHRLVDDLFTATSAVCVTGLMTIDLGTRYSAAGHAVILGLVQLGGLGYMLLYSFGLLLVGRRMSLRERLALRDATDLAGLGGLRRYVASVVKLLLAVELAATACLATQTVPEFGWARGLGLAAFLGVCAPNNAGFSPFPDGLARWQANPVVLGTLAAAIVVGGLGFPVARELVDRLVGRRPGPRGWTVLARIVVPSTVALLVGGTLAIWLFEHDNMRTLGPMPGAIAGLNAFFMAVQPRTSGFNSIDTGAMTPGSLLVCLAFMFVGTGPGGTGGGIKPTTVAVLGAAILAVLRGQADVNLPGLRRRVADALVRRALAVLVLSGATVGAATMAIAMLEPLPLLPILFEVTSAFGTAGLSMGITAGLGDASKLILVAVLLVGRVGPLMLLMALVPARPPSAVRHVEEPLMVG